MLHPDTHTTTYVTLVVTVVTCRGNTCTCDESAPVVFVCQEEEMSMLGEITHLQTLTDDLKALTMDPHKLPASSEQV